MCLAIAYTAPQPSDAKPQGGNEPPTDWIEPATGHRVLRLSKDPGTASFYFHQYSFTAEGDKLVVSSKGGLATLDLTTIGVKPCKIEQIVEGRGGSPVVGKKSREVFYLKGGSVFATHVDTKVTRLIVKLPAGYSGASGLAINADETLLASTARDPEAKDKVKAKEEAEGKPKGQDKSGAPPVQGKGRMTPGGRSMVLFTINIKSGDLKKIHYATDWLNHTQFSPTDPNRILFCHEGTWQLVDRIWTIRTDGTGLKLMHARTMPLEIAGHEFFSHDGKTVWFDLQTPREQVFWLAGVRLDTGERIRYPLKREFWSVHYNQSPDGKLFAGDGGGPNSVAHGGNGQWINLFTPDRPAPKAEQQAGKDGWLEGVLKTERLVDLSKHNYKLEPNVRFTPDGRWIVFRSNMHGPSHVYAVEVKKAEKPLQTKSNDPENVRQLREEQLERVWAALMGSCRKMLDMQIAVHNGTKGLHKVIQGTADEQPRAEDRQASLKLSENVKEIIMEATKTMEMVEAEGSAVAFPEIFRELCEDMKRVQHCLEISAVGIVTQALEQDIIDTLKEMIRALEKS
jgi:oligogalacturonide lyase